MNNNVNAAAIIISEAQKRAIWIPHSSGIKVSYQSGKVEQYYPPSALKKYAFDNGVLSWTNALGQFVLPYEAELIHALEHEDYKNGLQVPFSNGDYPVEFRETWARMRAVYNLSNFQQKILELEEISAEKWIRPLPESFLSGNCFEIPEPGIEVLLPNNEVSWFKPTHISRYDPESLKLLGTFGEENGIVAFVDEIGRMFCTRSSAFSTGLLIEHGFTKSSMPVPFSSGEHPKNHHLRADLGRVLTADF